MKSGKCINCGESVPRGMDLCPPCMGKAGAGPEEVEAAEELRDIANILSITSDTDANIKAAMQSILNIADRLERRS